MKKERVTTMPAQCGQSVAEEEIIDLTNYLNTGTNFVTAVERDWYVNKLNFSTVLPVQLMNFSETLRQQKVYLQWETAMEVNSSHFTIERSGDGNGWKQVAVVAAAGYSNSIVKYDMTDQNPFNGISFYRMKQTDRDGQSSISPIRRIERDIQWTIYPNPATDKIVIQGAAEDAGPVKVYNSIGQDISLQVSQKTVPGAIKQVDLSHQPAGHYFIKIGKHGKTVLKQ